MPTKITIESVIRDKALNWAHKSFPFQSHEFVTNHPWAVMVRLMGTDSSAYLKILPETLTSAKPSLGKISEVLAPHVPTLICSDTTAGFFLYQDHGAADLDRKPGHGVVREILTTYAELQTKAAQSPDLINLLPPIAIELQFDRFMEFLGAADPDASRKTSLVTASHFLKPETVERYRQIFSSVADEFRKFLSLQNDVPTTINHCDLRAKNIARKPDGSLVIFDWDDAVSGPPGLSLHAMFSGSARPYAALKTDPQALNGEMRQDRLLLGAYLHALCDTSPYERDKVVADLPAVICAGVFQYILNFGDYPVESRGQRDTIGKNIRRRLSDLMNVAHMLVLSSPQSVNAFSRALNENGRPKRAKLLLDAQRLRGSKTGQKETKDLPDAIAQSDRPGVFPTIDVSVEEQHSGVLSNDTRDLGVALFKRHGTLMIKNAMPVELINSCHGDFLAQYGKYLTNTRRDDSLRVGDKRFMITVKFAGPFAQKDLYASPLVMPILNSLLGKDAILGSLTTVVSLPGSEDQKMHKDNSALFKDDPDLQVPFFSITMIVPMVSLNAVNGATRVVKGSHVKSSAQAKKMPYQDPTVDLGSCFLMDCRLSHCGRGNNSKDVRPITSLVYQRPWFRDPLNFKKQKPLDIDAESFDRVPENLQHLVSWAVEA